MSTCDMDGKAVGAIARAGVSDDETIPISVVTVTPAGDRHPVRLPRIRRTGEGSGYDQQVQNPARQTLARMVGPAAIVIPGA
ncbi:hypothetical protein [Bradyrhizobium sp. SZCCHNR1051]|uniref:hypothetical protein n=1 Tax=Bradyrhizobium sp. SZCCHNR1051 TaxID=3057355 RepID=UPI0029164EEA|nr:hypothetical protein [Bradyrhizobium sp. SZCCHNR1051]